MFELYTFDHIVPWLVLTLALVLAFSATYLVLPSIILISKVKNLMDAPNGRKIHVNSVPTLGGVGIFFGIAMALSICGAFIEAKSLFPLLGALIIICMIGVKDDLLIITPKSKFLAQIAATLLMFFLEESRVIGFSGIFGIQELPYLLSLFFTFFLYLLIINAINLIDGIDGLAGSVGICSSVVYVFLFIQNKQWEMALASCAVIGALIPFLMYNFSKDNKIFMGDTGSLVLGFMLAFQTVGFLGYNQQTADALYHSSAPIVAIAILFFPLLDTLRIIFVRSFLQRRNPFKADTNHIHHRMLRLGLTHKQTTFLTCLATVFIIIVAFQCCSFSWPWHLLTVLVFGGVLFALPFYIKENSLKN
ncbi:MraY family glycosyltransferase [Mangrovimonas aestuarii]|uniref:MraY family glycosyltransferase n=1 Tax=Mangrovimonas aestuarii TaxID=3018443 RepID=UPI002377D3D5|nr:MraY family glycosyltransferase [Mangrovimonas aestuarii]